tara:strand:- start:82 stop:348 length:267 start_codon:yes stop_codon:yes gene_type:complete
MARSIHITGHVQDVCFRASVQEKAKEMNLVGWVRNTKQGGVEVHAEGEEVALNALEKWCHQGPPAANVESVIAKEVDDQHFPDFDIVF